MDHLDEIFDTDGLITHMFSQLCEMVGQDNYLSAGGLHCRVDDVSHDDAVMVTASDVLFARSIFMEPSGVGEPHRIQKICDVLLVDPAIFSSSTAGCHIWRWSCFANKCVCCTTLRGDNR